MASPAKRRSTPLLELRLVAAVYRFRESLFLLPAVIVIAGIVLSAVTGAIDDALSPGTHVPLTLAMSSNAATWLLSTVAGAMITTAGVVFSLTVVSLQLASSQFSPRVMRSFIRDRLSQLVIGLLVATFVYCVLVLRQVSAEPAVPGPRVSLTVAVVLTVTTVLLIVAHLDHLAHGLQVGNVVQAIAAEGELVLRAMTAAVHTEQPAAPVDVQADGPFLEVVAPQDGWVTQAPAQQMLAAIPPATTVRLETRIGAYIHEGEALATVRPVPADPHTVQRRLAATVMIDTSRTMQQDVDFALRQLVDIGLRALSAAVNDPTTAVEVTLRVGSLLRRLLVADLPRKIVAGSRDRILLRPWELTHDEYIAHGFDQLRQAAPPQPQVVAALLRVLRMLILEVKEVDRPEHLPALRRQARLLLESAQEQPGLHPDDLHRLRAVAQDATDPGDHTNDRPN